MRVRQLVPALSIIALAPAAFAADMPSVSWSGYIDNIFVLGDNSAKDTSNKDNEKLGGGFTSDVLLTANVKLGSVMGVATARASAGKDLSIAQSYIKYPVSSAVTLKAGKSYGPLGYISAESTGLSTINASLIGYGPTLYGAWPTGAEAVIMVNKEATLSLGVFNGIFGGPTDSVSPDYKSAPFINNGKKGTDWAWTADFVYKADKFMVNAEAVVDFGAVDKQTDPAKGANTLYLGINGDYMATDTLKVGGELIYKTNAPADKDKTLGLMAFANYTLAEKTFGFPAMLDGMVQVLRQSIDEKSTDSAAGKTKSDMGLQVALMTNPTGSSNLGWNIELGYASFNKYSVGGDKSVNAWSLATELLLSF